MIDRSRTAIVTGGSRGIGAGIARRLAADGFSLVINFIANAKRALALAAEIEAKGGRATAICADLADPASICRLFDAAEELFGPVDILVNNAGISSSSTIAEASDTHYRRQVEINLTGSFNGMREGARRIRNGGRIINLSSSLVGTYRPGLGVYAATKAAVETMTRVLAKELGPRGITVNAIAPGPVRTDLLLADRSPELLQQMTSEIPIGRLGEPSDVAGIVAFLAGPDSDWLSGQVIRINGGRN